MWSNALRDCLLLSVLTSIASAGSPTAVEWMRTFDGGRHGSTGWGVLQTSDGGYAVIGRAADTSHRYAYLVKTDSSGQTHWESRLAGSRAVVPRAIQQVSGDRYIVAGTMATDTFIDWLALLDDSGRVVWQRSIACLWQRGSVSAPWGDEGYSVVLAGDGGCTVAGLTAFRVADSALFVTRTDSLGNPIWRKRDVVDYPDCSDDIVQLHKTSDGGYILAAQVLVKMDSLGNQQWKRTYSGVSNANSVVQTTDGGFAATGPAPDAQGRVRRQIFLLKTDAQGSQQWLRKYAESGYSAGYSVVQCVGGGFVIAGETRESGLVLRTDSNGNLVWSLVVGPNDMATNIRQTTDGGYIVTGMHREQPTGRGNMFLMKLAPEE